MMTREEFIQFYAENSGVTVEDVLAVRKPEPCNCGAAMCVGWAMLPREGRVTPVDYLVIDKCWRCGNQTWRMRLKDDIATYECPACGMEAIVIIVPD